MKTITKLWIGIAILIVLSPLGLLLPDHFKAGTAWGEWGVDEIGKMTGYVPQGLAKLSELWKAPFPDYAFNGWEEKGIMHLSLAYIFSAVVGICIIAALAWLIGKLLTKKE
ncbi:MAG: PDGLE domain-containing protein [Endomicrobiales bacterium]|nr:PDGLE domain-containing protein [Endomicrobiales bacterium]